MNCGLSHDKIFLLSRIMSNSWHTIEWFLFWGQLYVLENVMLKLHYYTQYMSSFCSEILLPSNRNTFFPANHAYHIHIVAFIKSTTNGIHL